MMPSRDYMRDHLLQLNTVLAADQRTWILGEQYSLADISIACLLLRIEETGWLEYFKKDTNIEALVAYYDRLKGRVAWQEAITHHPHPIIDSAIQDLASAIKKDASISKLLYSA